MARSPTAGRRAAGDAGVQERDNPYAPPGGDTWLPDETRDRIRAWEEAPVLDELAVNAGYRATVVNLGLVGVHYHRLDEYVHARGADLAAELGISLEGLGHVCRCLLDDMRMRGRCRDPCCATTRRIPPALTPSSGPNGNEA